MIIFAALHEKWVGFLVQGHVDIPKAWRSKQVAARGKFPEKSAGVFVSKQNALQPVEAR
jgi:hypothetical protein